MWPHRGHDGENGKLAATGFLDGDDASVLE